MVPNGGVALFFATGPDNLYQFEQWRRPLERLAEDRPVFVIVDRPDTGELVLPAAACRWPSPGAARRWRSWSSSGTCGSCST